MIFLVLASAFAGTPLPTILPGASAQAPGEMRFTMGGMGNAARANRGGGAALGVEVGVTSGLLLRAHGGMHYNTDGDRTGAVGLAASFPVPIPARGLRFAPWVAVGQVFQVRPGGAAAVGLALDTGGKVVRFDLSMPIVGLAWVDDIDMVNPLQGLLVTEWGLSFVQPQWRVRIGAVSVLPGVTVLYDPGPVTLELTTQLLHDLDILDGAIVGAVGFRFGVELDARKTSKGPPTD